MVHRDPVLLSALSGELIKIKAVQLKPAQARSSPPDLDRNGKGGNPNATHLKYKIQIQQEEAPMLYT